MDRLTYYNILGVEPTATADEIKQAWEVKRRIHPDHFTNEKHKAHATREFQRLSEAYTVLKDPQKRDEYDQSLGDRSGSATSHNKEAPASSEYDDYAYPDTGTDDQTYESIKKLIKLDLREFMTARDPRQSLRILWQLIRAFLLLSALWYERKRYNPGKILRVWRFARRHPKLTLWSLLIFFLSLGFITDYISRHPYQLLPAQSPTTQQCRTDPGYPNSCSPTQRSVQATPTANQ